MEIPRNIKRVVQRFCVYNNLCYEFDNTMGLLRVFLKLKWDKDIVYVETGIAYELIMNVSIKDLEVVLLDCREKIGGGVLSEYKKIWIE